MTLSARLKTLLLEQQDKSQAGLARYAEVRPPSVNDWVSGKTKTMSSDVLFRVADYFGVDARWLATGEGQDRTDLPDIEYVYQHYDSQQGEDMDIRKTLDSLRALLQAVPQERQDTVAAALALLVRKPGDLASLDVLQAMLRVDRAFAEPVRKLA